MTPTAQPVAAPPPERVPPADARPAGTAGGHLLRPRLVALLAERFCRPVTVVAAPAGFGKTTVLAQAVAENRLAPGGIDVVVTCRAEHAAASTLVRELGAALGVPGTGGTGADLATVTDAVWHRSPESVALVLDDVHELPAGSAGAGAVSELVTRLPGNGHLVLSGREPLPVALARLEVQGHLQRIGPADLVFSGEELAELAAQRGVPVARLAGCGGWPALVELAVATSTEVEAAYLWEEILAGLAPERRRDLAVLAHLGCFDEELAAAALDRPVDLIALLRGFPLAGPAGARPDGREAPVHLIHPLWRPHLARVVDPAEIGPARRRAGVCLAGRGEPSAAVRLLAAAGVWDEVTRVVLDALGAAHPPLPTDVVAGWLDQLPDPLRRGALGRLLAAAGVADADPAAAAALFDEAAAAFRGDGQLAGELASLAQLGLLAWWREDPATMTAVMARVLELEAAGRTEAVPLACLARALVYDVANECEAALAELGRIPPGSFNRVWRSLVDWLRSTSLNHLGRPVEALAAAERACANAGPHLAPLTETARLQARWFQGEVDELLEGFPGIVARAEAAGLRNYTALLGATCCTALAWVGRVDEAAPFLERARASEAPAAIPLVAVNLVIAEAALAVARGDEEVAARSLARYLEGSPLLGTSHAAAPQQRTLALWYVLVPDTRPVWDAAELGPCFARARELARAVVAARDGDARPPVAELPAPDVVRAHLPLPWVAELGLAVAGSGDTAGWALLEAVWPAARPVARDRARQRGRLARPARAALARLPVPPPVPFELRLLGPTELWRGGVAVQAPEWRRERVRSLLAHLALVRPVSRERLADDLWPALDAEAQSRNLRVTLSYLLRVLEPERVERDASFMVAPHGGGLLLHRGEWLSADVWSFDDLWERAADADRRGLPSVALDLMQEAVRLWRGEPVELVDDWARAEVEERVRRLTMLAGRAGDLLLARGDAEGAREMGETALRADPWSDRCHEIVVAAHLAGGDRRAAHRAARRYQETLVDLGVDPAPAAQLLGAPAGQPRR